MPPALNPVDTDLRAAAKALDNFSLANQEFHVAVRYSEWERAAAAAERAVGYMQANFDLLMSANRHAVEAG